MTQETRILIADTVEHIDLYESNRKTDEVIRKYCTIAELDGEDITIKDICLTLDDKNLKNMLREMLNNASI